MGRDEIRSFRLTRSEAAALDEAARRLGMSVSDYIRRQVLVPELTYPAPVSVTLSGPVEVVWSAAA